MIVCDHCGTKRDKKTEICPVAVSVDTHDLSSKLDSGDVCRKCRDILVMRVDSLINEFMNPPKAAK